MELIMLLLVESSSTESDFWHNNLFIINFKFRLRTSCIRTYWFSAERWQDEDGMTLITWRLGRSLLWDATCVDTLAVSHIQATSSMVGAAATSAEKAKRRKYENLDSSFIFVPFGVETLGP
ncbi:jg12192 [Pararge aegeria aegeria]|uniref:Jg12192 protein n=1 Tax=Pararge aegeria aegeria TaxID=348720 RepID=A0A8S4RC07_9NEOP|nr:jg12192 [Pararge aegeria aegeria]